MASVTKAANAHTVVTTGWTNPSNAFATTGDNVYATAVSVQNGTVNGDFGFADFTTSDIPDGSVINSVTVTVEWGMTASVTGGTLGVQLRNNGVNLGSETTQTSTTEVQATQQVTTGITLSDLRSASTLIKARARTSKGNVATAMTGNLDFITLTVNFTPPPNHFPIQVVGAAQRAARDKKFHAGGVLIQGIAPWPPMLGTLTTTLPAITFALSGTVATPGSGGHPIIVIRPHSRSPFRGFAQLLGVEVVNNAGRISTTLPLLTMSLAGQVPSPYHSPYITQVKKAPLGNLSGGVTQLGHFGTPTVATGTISFSLTKILFVSTGTVRGNDITATLPLLSFVLVGQGDEFIPPSGRFVERMPHKKFPGKIRLPKPAVLPLSVGTGTINTTLPLILFSSTTSLTINGQLAFSIPKLTWTSSATVNLTGTIAATLPLLTFAMVSTVNVTAVLGLTIPLLQFNISEGISSLSQLILNLPRLVWQTSGEVRDLDGSLLGPGPTSGQLFPR